MSVGSFKGAGLRETRTASPLARRLGEQRVQGATSSDVDRVIAELPPTIRSNAPGSTTHVIVGP